MLFGAHKVLVLLHKLRLNHWSHMNYFYYVFNTLLGLESDSCIGCQWREDLHLCSEDHKILQVWNDRHGE